MAISLTNCRVQNNTDTMIVIKPLDQSTQVLTIPADGQASEATVTFNTINVNDGDQDTQATVTAQDSLCIFNPVNGNIVLMIPPNNSVTFSPD